LGYTVTTSTSSKSALVMIKTRPSDFDLVITDMSMPGITGDRLAAEINKINPDIPVIVCTGYSKKLSETAGAGTGIRAVLTKPVSRAELAGTIRRVLDEKTH
jgi:CheY-like chemotaxis protein